MNSDFQKWEGRHLPLPLHEIQDLSYFIQSGYATSGHDSIVD